MVTNLLNKAPLKYASSSKVMGAPDKKYLVKRSSKWENLELLSKVGWKPLQNFASVELLPDSIRIFKASMLAPIFFHLLQNT